MPPVTKPFENSSALYKVLDTEFDNFNDIFFNKLVDCLEENYIEFTDFEASYFKLDRMLTYARDKNSKVYNSKKYGNKISIIGSDNRSVFSDSDDNNYLSINKRRNFLELINTSNFETLFNLINGINSKSTHSEIKKIQTILDLLLIQFVAQDQMGL